MDDCYPSTSSTTALRFVSVKDLSLDNVLYSKHYSTSVKVMCTAYVQRTAI